MHCWILSSWVEAKARASSSKRRCPSSVNFQRQDRGHVLAPPCMLTGTFSKLSRKQRLWRMVFFQPSGAVRKKGKCCLWTGRNGKEWHGFFEKYPTFVHTLPQGPGTSVLLSRWRMASWPRLLFADWACGKTFTWCIACANPHFLNPVYCPRSQTHFSPSLWGLGTLTRNKNKVEIRPTNSCKRNPGQEGIPLEDLYSETLQI